MDTTSSESEVEWGEEIGQDEDDENLLMMSSISTPDQSEKSLELTLDRKSKRKKHNFYEKAMISFQKEVVVNLHKVHLLCLLAHSRMYSSMCDDPLVQSLIISLTPSIFSLVSSCETNETVLPKLMRWFSSSASTLQECIGPHLKNNVYTDVQLLVSLLRGLGLRTRIVLVLKVSPLKSTKSTKDSKKKVPIQSHDVSPDYTTNALVNEPLDMDSNLKQFKYKKEDSQTNKRKRKVQNITKSPYFDDITMTSSSLPSKRPKLNTNDAVAHDNYNSWTEILLANKWMCLHLPSISVNQPHLCEKHCQHQMNYIIAIENDHMIYDVTPRYASQWCTSTCKNRIDSKWWSECLQPFTPPIEECELENEDITASLLSKPLPTTASDYRTHPLYVLRSHLLKFEAIYPEDSEVIDYFRGAPVYSRSCVHNLHTRETWLKEGRIVKKGEKPYKSVKGRRRKGQTTLEAESNMIDVFGKWQTEEYIPPPVVDGKVPRNEYGNVELFQSSMLPAGSVHLNEPGIARVARKLNLDYAPAMKGWDFHGGYCHPIIEGIVVAEEFKDILIEAWLQEQQIIIEKESKKREKRILERWIKLTKGLLVRERVKKRFLLTQ